jgi:predicted transcriptional regulator
MDHEKKKGRCTMNDVLSITAEKIYDVLQKKGSVSLTHLESMVNVSYNLLFLAIDRLSAENRIRIRKKESGYILSAGTGEGVENGGKTVL